MTNPRKPEKKELKLASSENPKTYQSYELGFNRACDIWNEYHEWSIKTEYVRKDSLPSEDELDEIMTTSCHCMNTRSYKEGKCSLCGRLKESYAIHKKLGGKQ